MSNLTLADGAGSFVFRDEGAVPSPRTMRVFSYCPRSRSPRTRIIVAMHGVDRAAAEFRDLLAPQAERNGQIVLVPEFDPDQFPGVYAYNFGGVRRPPPDNAVLPRDHWSFGVIDRLFQHVRHATGSSRDSFGLFGNSAGAQFVLRYLALNEAGFVDRAVAANCGCYMLPDLAKDYPDGMGGIGLDESHLRRYLGRRLIILLGEADNDPDAADLPRWDEAMAQGPHRLARGLWHFEHCTTLAKSLGVALGWRLEIAPGAGHVHQLIYDQGANILNG
ncbi:dienelactone hydrolase [Bradyrhizobium sp. USDA 4449]